MSSLAGAKDETSAPQSALEKHTGKASRGSSDTRDTSLPTDTILVRFKPNALPAETSNVLTSCGATVSAKPDPRHEGRYTLKVSSVDEVAGVLHTLSKSPLILWAQVDCKSQSRPKYLPDDASFTSQWYLHNTGQSGSMTNRDLSAEKAWDITRGTSNVVIAILDDGFDLTHPDLAANVFINPGEYGGGRESDGVDDDGNGYKDDWRGWDFIDGDNDPSPALASNNHGTTMAGLAVAVAGNGIGIAGLANRCRFLPIRVASTNTTYSTWAQAIEYAAQFADVISISYYLDTKDAIYDALDNALVRGRGGKGSVICTALGNSGIKCRYTSDAAAAPETISVSGNSNYDKRSWFADYGPSMNMVCPAGGGGYGNVDDRSRLLTTDRTGAAGYTNIDYTWQDGTSCACPLAAATAALIISQNPALTGLEVRRILETSCDKIDAGAFSYDKRGRCDQYGFGRVNALAALTTPSPSPWDSFEPDDTSAGASEIFDGEIQYRSLSTGADLDWAFFRVSNQTAQVRLTVLGTTNTSLRLYDAATNPIVLDDYSGWPSYAYFTKTLTNGTYYVRVESPNNVGVPHYGLHLAFLNFVDEYEPDDLVDNARELVPRVMQYKTLYPSNDIDWATFTLASPQTVEIRTMGEWKGWLEMSLWNTNGLYAYSYHTNVNAYLGGQLPAGTYWVEIKERDGYQLPSYQLLLETHETDAYEDDSTTNRAAVIASGQRLTHTLYPAGDTDWLRFELTNRANVLVMTDTINPWLYPGDGDTKITLYRDIGSLQFVTDNDDGNNWYFSAIFRTGLNPGTYYIRVQGYDVNVVCPDYYVSLDVFENQTRLDEVIPAMNGIQMRWQGDASFIYKIEYAESLEGTQVWSVATNAEGRIGRNTWTDDGTATTPGPNEASRRFYRLNAR